MNGDGQADLVVTNGGDSVSVLLGQGDGTFVPADPGEVAVGARPVEVVLADLNSDGWLDILTANRSGSSVSVLLGRGDGTFRSPAQRDYAVGLNPVAITVGDIDHDGILDVVTANAADHTVSVLLGLGGGSLAAAPQRDITVGDTPSSVILADINGDRSPDIITANFGGQDVSLLLGQGDSTFNDAAPRDTIVGMRPYTVVVADVNGDSHLDIITANFYDSTISVLRGDGSGGLASAPAHDSAVGRGPIALAVTDIDGDGQLDIATANFHGNSVSLLLGRGDGSFSTMSPRDIAVDDGPVSVALADVNGDGQPDIVTANANGNSISVLLGLRAQ